MRLPLFAVVRTFAALSLAVVLVGCAAQIQFQTPAQREEQARTLRENATRLRLLVLESTQADVQRLMGVAPLRDIFRSGSDSESVEVWHYPHEQGWAILRFNGGKLVESKSQRALFVYVRDATLPLTQEDLKIRAALSIVQLGWTKAQVEGLTVEPSTRWSESATADEVGKRRSVHAASQYSPLMSGIDARYLYRDLRGEMWEFKAARTVVTLLLRDGRVEWIHFLELPTDAQQNELMQKAF